MKGTSVSSGYISQDTQISFHSASASVYIMIQMSEGERELLGLFAYLCAFVIRKGIFIPVAC